MDSTERGETEVTEAQNPTYAQKLSAGENLWAWKLGLRAILLVVAVIGIGCIAWATSTALSNVDQDEFSEFFDDLGVPWGLITLGLSFIWGIVCILVLLIRKRPIHAGAAVGVDLVLWLFLIITALFAAFSASTISSFGAGGYIEDPNSGGVYYLAPNGTWVFNSTSDSGYYSPYYDNLYGPYNRTCVEFESCAQEDALVNQLWHERNHRAGVEWTGVACQAIAVVIHFALFVWACCDTHARRSKRTRKDAEVLAEKIIADLREKGQLLPPQGTQQMQQPLLERREGRAPVQEYRGTSPSASATRDAPRVRRQENESHGISPAASPAEGIAQGTVRDV